MIEQGTRVRHKENGHTYVVLGTAPMKLADGRWSHSVYVIYTRDSEREPQFYIRHVDNFNQRFERAD